MGYLAVHLPDVGEGVAEAELVEINVAPGDPVREDDVLAAVMTDKATVEIPSTADGTVTWISADVGAVLSVGAEFIRLEIDGSGNVDGPEPAKGEHASMAEQVDRTATEPIPAEHTGLVTNSQRPVSTPATTRPNDLVDTTSVQAARTPVRRGEGEKPLASPSVRARARENGVDLRRVLGSGPAGRITHEDLDNWFETGGLADHPSVPIHNTSVDEVQVIGLRRKIAEQMMRSKSSIPHVTIVEEVDMTTLEDLRGKMNAAKDPDQSKLTLLPFLFSSMVKAVSEQPIVNARYDDQTGLLSQFGGVHIGMATQTDAGLMVPVLRHAEARGLFEMSDEIQRLASAARNGSITREELTGSTITVTSLGALGAIATTPIINHPEVSIVGVNKMSIRPIWDGQNFVPRKMMNLSCSFDHRIIDGWDAAVFVQNLKDLLETPALIFVKD